MDRGGRESSDEGTWYMVMARLAEERAAGVPSDAMLVWVGNRWQSAPDRLKDHDFETWLPIDFTAANASEPALPKQRSGPPSASKLERKMEEQYKKSHSAYSPRTMAIYSDRKHAMANGARKT